MFATNNWICKSVSAANLIHTLHGFDPRPVLRFRRSIRLFPIPLINYLWCRRVLVLGLTKCEEKKHFSAILTSSSNRNAAEKQNADIAMPLRNLPQQNRPFVITGDQHQ